MPKGPAPKPTELRLLHGDRADRVNEHEPIPVDEAPQCPDEVSDAVREIWDYTVEHLDHMGLAKACDRDALLCYCEAVIRHRQASRVLAQSPILIKGRNDSLVTNPAVRAQRDAAHVIRHFAQEFGLTPSARSRIEVDRRRVGDDENPFAGTG